MKRISLIAAIAALALVGCSQPKGPQTTELAPPPYRPLEDLSPAPTAGIEAPAPAPAAATEPLPEIVSSDPEPAPELMAPPAPPAPRSHTIRKGDTLWSLAVLYLGDGQRWQDIASLNPGVKPQAMRIGTKLLIPEK
ncbi:MAG: LysM peptidoglycan-binding domain-containing protein [Planctomycetota bacterium]|jgi:nucleoid-associated protein YgaU